MKNPLFNIKLAAPSIAALTVVTLTVITAFASGPTGGPPGGNVDATFNTISAGNGAASLGGNKNAFSVISNPSLNGGPAVPDNATISQVQAASDYATLKSEADGNSAVGIYGTTGTTSSHSAGVVGISQGDAKTAGVYGGASLGNGTMGTSDSGTGVVGQSTSGGGGVFTSNTGTALTSMFNGPVTVGDDNMIAGMFINNATGMQVKLAYNNKDGTPGAALQTRNGNLEVSETSGGLVPTTFKVDKDGNISNPSANNGGAVSFQDDDGLQLSDNTGNVGMTLSPGNPAGGGGAQIWASPMAASNGRIDLMADKGVAFWNKKRDSSSSFNYDGTLYAGTSSVPDAAAETACTSKGGFVSGSSYPKTCYNPINVTSSSGLSVTDGSAGGLHIDKDGNLSSNSTVAGGGVNVFDTDGLFVGTDAGSPAVAIKSKLGNYASSADFTGNFQFAQSSMPSMLTDFGTTGGIAVNGPVYSEALLVKDPASGLSIDSDAGGMTITTKTGGATIYATGAGGGLTVNTASGGIRVSKQDGTFLGTPTASISSSTGTIGSLGAIYTTDAVSNAAVMYPSGAIAGTNNIFSTNGSQFATLNPDGSINATSNIAAGGDLSGKNLNASGTVWTTNGSAYSAMFNSGWMVANGGGIFSTDGSNYAVLWPNGSITGKQIGSFYNVQIQYQNLKSAKIGGIYFSPPGFGGLNLYEFTATCQSSNQGISIDEGPWAASGFSGTYPGGHEFNLFRTKLWGDTGWVDMMDPARKLDTFTAKILCFDPTGSVTNGQTFTTVVDVTGK